LIGTQQLLKEPESSIIVKAGQRCSELVEQVVVVLRAGSRRRKALQEVICEFSLHWLANGLPVRAQVDGNHRGLRRHIRKHL
jgi:hypothetical protein